MFNVCVLLARQFRLSDLMTLGYRIDMQVPSKFRQYCVNGGVSLFWFILREPYGRVIPIRVFAAPLYETRVVV